MRMKPYVVVACAVCWLLVVINGSARTRVGEKKTVTAKPKNIRKRPSKVVKTVRPAIKTRAVKEVATTSPGSILAEGTITRAAHVRIEAALDTSLPLLFDEAPLCEVIDFVRATKRIPIIIDKRGLDEAGIPSDTPVTIHLHGVSLRSALRLMLYKLELTYRINDGLLIITTPEEAENNPSVCVYPIGDLLQPQRPSLFSPRNAVSETYDELITLITSTIAVDSWSDMGGSGSIEPLPSQQALVISQTNEAQRDVANLLHVIRELNVQTRAADKTKSGPPVAGLSVLGPRQQQAEKRIMKALATRIPPWHFDDAPLSEVADFVSGSLQIPVAIDTRALDEAGMTEDTPVTLHLSEVPLQSALAILLDQLELTYTITNEVLLITTPEEAENLLKVRVYPVADLVQVGDDIDDAVYDRLIKCITSTVAPDSWSDVGGTGRIEPFVPTKALVICQTDRTQRKIENLFAALRSLKSTAGTASHSTKQISVPAIVQPNPREGDARSASVQYVTVYDVNMKREQLRELSKTIRILVNPDTWGDRDGMATIQIVGRKLLVRQTAQGQRMVRELIDKLSVPSAGFGAAQ